MIGARSEELQQQQEIELSRLKTDFEKAEIKAAINQALLDGFKAESAHWDSTIKMVIKRILLRMYSNSNFL